MLKKTPNKLAKPVAPTTVALFNVNTCTNYIQMAQMIVPLIVEKIRMSAGLRTEMF